MNVVKYIAIGAIVLLIIQQLGQRTAPPGKGEPAMDFSAQLMDGSQFRLSEHRGKVVVIDFWATWCPPCRETMPALQKVYESAQKTGDVVVVSVSIDSGTNPMRVVDRYVSQWGYTFPVILDARREIANLYKIKSVPTMVVIKPDGVVSNIMQGLPSGSTDAIVKHIEKAIESAR